MDCLSPLERHRGARPLRRQAPPLVGQGARFALAGVTIGSTLALAGARGGEPLLFRQSATDPDVSAWVAFVLLAAALLASAIPAVRPMQADPNALLRAE